MVRAGLRSGTRRGRRALPLVGVAALLLLAGCAGQASGSAPEGGGTTSAPAASTAPTTAASSTLPVDPPCTSAQLRAAWRDDGAASAGGTAGWVVLQNAGTAACTVQGWPRVVLVAAAGGAAIGSPAQQDHGSDAVDPTVLLSPGDAAQAHVVIGDAAALEAARCAPAQASGLRVVPAGAASPLYVAHATTGCSSHLVALLEVRALVPAT